MRVLKLMQEGTEPKALHLRNSIFLLHSYPQ